MSDKDTITDLRELVRAQRAENAALQVQMGVTKRERDYAIKELEDAKDKNAELVVRLHDIREMVQEKVQAAFDNMPNEYEDDDS